MREVVGAWFEFEDQLIVGKNVGSVSFERSTCGPGFASIHSLLVRYSILVLGWPHGGVVVLTVDNLSVDLIRLLSVRLKYSEVPGWWRGLRPWCGLVFVGSVSS